MNQTASQQRTGSGVINATQLPPIDGIHPQITEEEMMQEEMRYQMEMEGMEDPYGAEMDDMEGVEETKEFGFGDMKALFQADEMKGKDHLADARKANFISKGSYIYGLLN